MGDAPKPILAVSNLWVTFPAYRRETVRALKGIDLRIDAGEFIGLVGESGAGKTTLFNAISGLVPITTGQIRIDGAILSGRPAHERSKHGISRTFQSVQLIQESSVIENVLIGMHSRIKQGLFDLFGEIA